jgi:GYF domain 2
MDLAKPVLIQGYGVNMFAIEQIERMLARGEVTPDRKFFQEGMESWVPLSELAALLGKPPGKVPAQPRPNYSSSQAARLPLDNLPGNVASAPDPSASSFRRVSSIKLAKGTLRFRTDLKNKD